MPKTTTAKRDTQMKLSSSDLKSFQTHLQRSKKILALVGAGLSASSGLPTFRGAGGLWKDYDAMDLATPEAFQNDPSLVWQFYSHRRGAALRAKPNHGHYALAELARRRKKFMTLTQNVDSLSDRAGHPRDQLLKLHGDLFSLRCTNFFCSYAENNNYDHPLTPALKEDESALPSRRKLGRSRERSGDTSTIKEGDTKNATEYTSDVAASGSPRSRRNSENGNGDVDPLFEGLETLKVESPPIKHIPESELPKCPKCKSGILRPGVVWFGEPLPLNVMDKADAFISENGPVDLILVIGTSCNVWPAAGFVERVRMNGGKVAVFNLEVENKTEIEREGGWAFIGDAARWLPKALEPIIGRDYVSK